MRHLLLRSAPQDHGPPPHDLQDLQQQVRQTFIFLSGTTSAQEALLNIVFKRYNTYMNSLVVYSLGCSLLQDYIPHVFFYVCGHEKQIRAENL